MSDRDKIAVPEPRSIDTDYRTLEAAGRLDDRRSLFMVEFGDWRCSLGACHGPAGCLRCSTGVWRYVDGGRCVDVAVYVAFQVLLVDLRFARDWSERIHERFTAIPRRSHDASQGPALFGAEDEAALFDVLAQRFQERHGPLLQSVEHLPNLSL
ncbi:hypothetical protein GCM10028794_24030 [Silanimonas algicola]